jgi:hypothetical protein
MTKIVDSIKAVQLNDRCISNWIDIRSAFTIDNDDLRLSTRLDVLRRYDIEVKLGANVVVAEHQHDHLSSMIDNVKRAVIEELYGEFRKPLIELEMIIAEGHQQEALEKVRKMHRSMFGLEN